MRLFKSIKALFVLFLIIQSSISSGQVITVAKNGGDYTTIQAAVNAAMPGNTIEVYPGTYHEAVVINKPNLNLVGKYLNDPPIISGADTSFNPVWQHVQGHIYKTSYTWHRPQPNDDQYTDWVGGTNIGLIALQVYEDSRILRGYRNLKDPRYWDEETHTAIETGVEYSIGIAGAYRNIEDLNPAFDIGKLPQSYEKHDIRIPGRFLYKEDDGELYVWSHDENQPENHQYKIPVIFRLIDIQSPNTVVRNFVFEYSEGFAVHFDNADNSIFENNYIVNTIYPLESQSTNNLIIRNNFIKNSGIWEKYWYLDCKSTILWAHCLHIYGDSIDVYNNIITNNYSALLYRGNAIKFHHNIVSKNMSTFVDVDQLAADTAIQAEIEIFSNIFHHVDDNAIGISTTIGGPMWIYRNLIYRVNHVLKNGGITIEQTRGKCHFYHNTCALYRDIVNSPYRYPPFKNTILRNNIFYAKSLDSSNSYYWTYNEQDPAMGWHYTPFDNGPDTDYNLLWLVHGNPTSLIARFLDMYGLDSTYVMSEFNRMQQEIGIEVNSIQADPEFVNKQEFIDMDLSTIQYDFLSELHYTNVVGNYDYLFNYYYNHLWEIFDLSANSPAVNQGEVLPAFWPDNVFIADGQPDIGAQEMFYVSVAENPNDFGICYSYPNPFNSSTKIVFTVKKQQNVNIEIYDSMGAGISTLLNQNFGVGKHEVIWEGTNYGGKHVPPGIYYCQLQTKHSIRTIKMILIK